MLAPRRARERGSTVAVNMAGNTFILQPELELFITMAF
jgi:hypothetical protein